MKKFFKLLMAILRFKPWSFADVLELFGVALQMHKTKSKNQHIEPLLYSIYLLNNVNEITEAENRLGIEIPEDYNLRYDFNNENINLIWGLSTKIENDHHMHLLLCLSNFISYVHKSKGEKIC